MDGFGWPVKWFSSGAREPPTNKGNEKMSDKTERKAWSPRPWHSVLSGLLAGFGEGNITGEGIAIVLADAGMSLIQATEETVILTCNDTTSATWVAKSSRIAPASASVWVTRGRLGTIPVVTIQRGEDALERIAKRDEQGDEEADE